MERFWTTNEDVRMFGGGGALVTVSLGSLHHELCSIWGPGSVSESLIAMFSCLSVVSQSSFALSCAVPESALSVRGHALSGRADKNPYDFLKLLQTSFGNIPGIMDKDKCERFYLNCKSDFDVEEWYHALPAVTKIMWSALATAFHIHWPKRVKIQKTPEQKKDELFAQRLDEERMLEKEIIGEAPVYAYITWEDHVNTLSTALGDTQGFLISVIQDMLPKALHNMIGTSHDTWPVFIATVRAVSPTVLQLAIDNEK